MVNIALGYETILNANEGLNCHGRDSSHWCRTWQGHSPARSETAPVIEWNSWCLLASSDDKPAPVGEDLVGAIEDEGGPQQGRAHHLASHHLEIVIGFHPLTEAILGQGGDIPPGGEIPPILHRSQHGGWYPPLLWFDSKEKGVISTPWGWNPPHSLKISTLEVISPPPRLRKFLNE